MCNCHMDQSLYRFNEKNNNKKTEEKTRYNTRVTADMMIQFWTLTYSFLYTAGCSAGHHATWESAEPELYLAPIK